MMGNARRFASGWHRDLPDHRDYTLRHETISVATARLSALDGRRPEQVDWRDYCSAIEDQQQLATSPVHACLGMVQYFERRAHGRQIEPSRLFVYKNVRRLLNWTGDSGASLRATLKSIRRFGLPPEAQWPYRPENVEREPEAFTYSFQQESSTLAYVRIDVRGLPGAAVLESARGLLAAGFSFVLGFPLSTSLGASPLIPYPTLLDAAQAGQAALAVGYDDRLRIRSDKGALLIRNSWGEGWGDGGYGWLPYAYVRDGLAADLWTLIKPDWLESGEFRHPAAALSEGS